MDYPRMLYRFPAQGGPGVTTYQLQDDNLRSLAHDTREVATADEFEAAKADGWRERADLARAAHFQALADAAAAAQAAAEAEAAGMKAADTSDDNLPPTRAELEAKATELGIEFDGRTTDKALARRIGEALKA